MLNPLVTLIEAETALKQAIKLNEVDKILCLSEQILAQFGDQQAAQALSADAIRGLKNFEQAEIAISKAIIQFSKSPEILVNAALMATERRI